MRQKTLAGVLAGLSLLAASCGDDAADEPLAAAADASTATSTGESTGESTATSTGESTATSTGESTGESTAASGADVPTAIISLSPAATEMLYAIGAGEQVLAVDDFSNYPPETADKMLGVSAFDPSVEAIAGLEPDLVVTDGTNPDLLAQLDDLGIPRWEGPAATGFGDVYAQIDELGDVTGHADAADALIAELEAEVADVKAGLPDLTEPLSYYHELDESYYTVTSQTFIGAVYGELGLVNIADAAGADSFYPQLSAEFIIAENPDLIFLACSKYCGTTAASVAARPGWAQLDAVINGAVVEMDDDLASRWGPRVVDYLRTVGDAVDELAARPAG